MKHVKTLTNKRLKDTYEKKADVANVKHHVNQLARLLVQLVIKSVKTKQNRVGNNPI